MRTPHDSPDKRAADPAAALRNASERLRRGLAHADPEIRRQAVESVAQERDVSIQMLLVPALGDIDWRVRAEAARALAVGGLQPEIASRLVDVIAQETDVGYRNAAVDALGAGGELTVRTLEPRLSELDADGRKLAVDALAKAAERSSLPVLSLLVKDEDVNVAAAAIEALARVTPDRSELALPGIEHGLAHPHQFVRLVALDAANALSLRVRWSTLEEHLKEPALALAVLELAAKLGEPKAGPHFVEQLERTTGNTWRSMLGALRVFSRVSFASNLAARTAIASASETMMAEIRQAAGLDCTRGADALIVLCLRGGEPALDALRAWIGLDEYWDVAREAILVLGPSAIPTLVKALGQGDEKLEEHALEHLVRLAENVEHRALILEQVRLAEAKLAPPAACVWLAAVARWGTEVDFEALMARWKQERTPMLRRALLAATESCSLRFVELAQRIARQIEAGAPESAAVLAMIGVAGTPLFGSTAKDQAYLERAFAADDRALRIAVLEALAKGEQLESETIVGAALLDPSAEIQIAAVRTAGVLAQTGAAWARGHLVRLLTEGTSMGVGVAAASALGSGRDALLLDESSTLWTHPDAWRAAAAVGALGTFDPIERLPVLRKALGHSDPVVVRRAIDLVVPSQDAVEDLRRCLYHPQWDVRRAAAVQLGAGTSEVSGPVLVQRLAEENEPLVVEAIYRSLSHLAGNRPLSIRVHPTTPEPA